MALVLHLLMLFLLSGGSARVVTDFEQECGQFFAGRKSPTTFSGQQYKNICQTLNGVAYYATYYDTYNKIPVYSAYRFEGKMGCKRLDKWHIEPQLDDINETSMKFENEEEELVKKTQANMKTQLGDNQALNKDYVKSGSDKGHLEPVFQANSQECADATFTLTNAAPQNPSFNRGQWRVLEEKMAETLSEQCLPKYSAFIVTGVVPGKSKINNRVNVPSHFWTAYSCLDNNNKCKFSAGFIGENKNIQPVEKTVHDLETDLATLYNVQYFEVFDSSGEPPAKKQKI